MHPVVPQPTPITRVTKELSDTISIHLDVSARGFSYRPGQFNMLYLFGVGEVPISISGDREQGQELVHTIRAVGGVTRPMRTLKTGDFVGLRGPYGTYWPMEEAHGKDLLIAAGGLGLAPLRPAIVHALTHRDRYRRVIVLYGARSPDELLFLKEVERWRGRMDTEVAVTVDHAGDDWFGHVGVVTALVPRATFEAKDTVAFVCGPEVMIRFTVRELERRGVSREAIWVSMERSMKCAIGHCGHCQYGSHFVCKDGPVYRFDRLAPIFHVREV